MPLEIERKFLVQGDFKSQAESSVRIVQGYLSSNPERSVRIRIKGGKAFITVKGKGNESGMTRFEWEKEINVGEAENLLKLCEPGKIEKVRYFIPVNDNLQFEVDEFHGDNEGLIIAEIELKSEDELFEKPNWLGKEVTGNAKYYNSALVKNPYNKW